MGSPRLSLKRSVLLSAFALVSILSSPAIGQATSAPVPAPAPAETPASSEAPAPAPVPAASSTVPPVNTPNPQPPATQPAPQSSTPAAPPPPASSSSSVPAPISATAPPSSANNGPRPSISATGPASGGGGIPPPLPTLSSPAGIPNYPPPAVPPTQKAPFMDRSSLPDGTVFIAVGAILAAFAAAVIAWRGIIACLLHRSVQRAALEQQSVNDKATFAAPQSQFYKYSDKESSASLATPGARGVGARRSHRGPTPSATPSQTNLFFSPTAPGAAMNGGGGRDSRFLPSGFYAAGGSSSPAYGHGHSISLTNLRPDSRAHSRVMGPTPPDSPSLGPSRVATTPVQRNVSSTSLNLNRPPSGRAPSAYLDDLLDDHHQPGAFPPPAVPGAANHQHSFSNSTTGAPPARY